MQFDLTEEIIMATEPEQKRLYKGHRVIAEGETSSNFFYLKEGELSVFNFTEEGKEFLQHKVVAGSFFGEPAVLLEKPFPGNVEVMSDKAILLKINREKFLNFLMQNPEIHIEFTKSIAKKSIRKSNTLRNIVFLSPEDRIWHQIQDYKREQGAMSSEKIQINLTRKELSNMTGLRIETVIRTVKKMEKEGRLSIISGKIIV
ncbi:MAG: Crp/Fnr family transcriptional regulator [Bergeyella zoohelcum]|nr:Crp/Fnr family transcriptional regulator [Bergeyella zoohelcum]